MLSMYLGKMEEAVYYPPVYFDNRYEDEWITDKQFVEIIRDVDKSDENILPIKPEKIIVEDSNSGYDFFHSVSEDQASEEYIESSEFFSWERYFTKLLIEQTEGTYLKYKKSRLNKFYLHEKNKDTILKSIKGIKFKNY